MPIATRLGRVVTYHEGLPTIRLHDHSITCLAKSLEKKKSTARMLTVIKRGRVAIYLEQFLSIKSYNPLIMYL